MTLFLISLALYLNEGKYRATKYIGKLSENDWHFVEISKKPNGNYKWKNRANVEWDLIPIADVDNMLRVGKECPYYKNGYTSAVFNETGIFGPWKEFYAYQKGNQ